MEHRRKASLSWGRFAWLAAAVSAPFAGLLLILHQEGDAAILLGLGFGWIWMMVYAFYRWRALRKRFAGDGEAMVMEMKRNPSGYLADALRSGVRWVVAAAVVMMVLAVVMGLRGR